MNKLLKNFTILGLFVAANITNLSCQDNKHKMNKYEWLPGVCAPEFYPVEIYSGYISTQDKPTGIPSGGILEAGWGTNGKTMGDGRVLKSAPKGFGITYLSFTENKFYTGDFELPYDSLDKLFKEGFIEHGSKEWGTFRSVIIGMAPGGMIVVWLGHPDWQIEVGRYQAHATEVDWQSFNPSGEQDRNIYVSETVAENEKAVKSIDLNGPLYNPFEKYRQKYFWKPEIVLPDKFFLNENLLEMYNAEFSFLWGKYLIDTVLTKRAVPERTMIRWTDENGNRFASEIDFDEEEVFKAFSEIFKDNKEVHGVLNFTLEDDLKTFTVRLRNYDTMQEYEMRNLDQGSYARRKEKAKEE